MNFWPGASLINKARDEEKILFWMDSIVEFAAGLLPSQQIINIEN